ncbi:hypothetical protein Ctob_013966, partial [Chrysochromulina tobinii]
MAYLSGILQLKWNADKVSTIRVTRRKSDSDVYYRQDLTLRSQRVITSSTGEMRYSQKIIVDKVGRNCFCALVTLDPEQPSTAKKPFNTLTVYVGLEQRANDVNIYAAGVMEVNRKVVPNLVIFDASGIAGDMAGKGTLWLSGHFMERKRAAAAAASQRATDHAEKAAVLRVAEMLSDLGQRATRELMAADALRGKVTWDPKTNAFIGHVKCDSRLGFESWAAM